MENLNIALIGCGMIGREHIERIQNRIRGAKIVAVCDVFEEGAKKGAEIAGAGGLGLDQRVSGDGSNVAVPCGGAAGLTLECVVNPVLNLNVVGVDEAQDPVVLDLGGNLVSVANGREDQGRHH